MTKLTDKEIKLAEQLLLSIKNMELHIGYKELGERVVPPIFHRQVPNYIGEISKLCYELGLPFLSAKVINKDTKTAGYGFYKLYLDYFPEAKNLTPDQVYFEECKKINDCTEWYKLADYLHIEIDLSRPDDELPSIRILPMSKEEFPEMDIEDVQNDYFLGDLIEHQNGMYYYRNSGMNSISGTLVLFQFDNMIIASAKLSSIEKYDSPQKGKYYGAYKFDVSTVRVFQPISLEEINKIDKNITTFSQSKQRINISYWPEIEELIKSKEITYLPEEISPQGAQKLKEGAKKQVLVNSYERNSKARKACIDYYGCTCSVCGFDFGAFYGEEFKGKIHVHHIKALSDINEEYEVDPISDLRPVCPNCHLALHSKTGDKSYSIGELIAKIENN